MEDPVSECYKLWPSITDRRAFVQLIDGQANLTEIEGLGEDDDLVGKLAPAAHAAFRARILGYVIVRDSYEEERLERLFEALKDGLAVVSIELEGGDDPQTIFETLNSRGVALAPADLLRNFIFQRAKGLGQTHGSLAIDKLYQKHWLPLDRTFWNRPASRGRQTRTRLDWMLTDHLAVQIEDIVSAETLFPNYRKRILDRCPYQNVTQELEAISATAGVERRLFEPENGDPAGRFGKMADAFDVSTAMPLAIYLATEPSVGSRLAEAFEVLESYILRRDICGLTTKNYNRFFVAIISRLRGHEGDKIDNLIAYLSSRTADLDRWPDDTEWRRSWLFREQYRSARQPRLRYVLETIERAKHHTLAEEIAILSALTIEHILPQKWQFSWVLPGMAGVAEQAYDQALAAAVRARNAAVNVMGNLTLLTMPLNSSVSNGPFEVKMPAVRANSKLTLNLDLHAYTHWNEQTIQQRGEDLFDAARQIWRAPDREELPSVGAEATPSWTTLPTPIPEDGTSCRFVYNGKAFLAVIEDGAMVIEGLPGRHSSFSAASKAVSGTSRNGWQDWFLLVGDQWLLAHDWRMAAG